MGKIQYPSLALRGDGQWTLTKGPTLHHRMIGDSLLLIF